MGSKCCFSILVLCWSEMFYQLQPGSSSKGGEFVTCSRPGPGHTNLADFNWSLINLYVCVIFNFSMKSS